MVLGKASIRTGTQNVDHFDPDGRLIILLLDLHVDQSISAIGMMRILDSS